MAVLSEGDKCKNRNKEKESQTKNDANPLRIDSFKHKTREFAGRAENRGNQESEMKEETATEPVCCSRSRKNIIKNSSNLSRASRRAQYKLERLTRYQQPYKLVHPVLDVAQPKLSLEPSGLFWRLWQYWMHI